mgnify:CR=1 FL=1
MNIVSKSTDYVKLISSTDLTIPPAPFIRCPMCFGWTNSPARVDAWRLNNERPIFTCWTCFERFESHTENEQAHANYMAYSGWLDGAK